MCLRVLKLSCLLALFQCSFLNGFSQNVLSPFPIDACNTYTFRSQTGDAAYDNHINDMYGNSTGNSFQVGYTTINGSQDGLLQQLDINGKVVWSKTLGNSSVNERIQSIGKLPDGTLVMTGTIENTNGTSQHPFVAAADMAGTLLWIRSIQTATDYRGAYVLATTTGTIGMVAEDDSTMLYARFNAAGNMAWLNKVQALPKSKTIGMVEAARWFIGYTGEQAGRKTGGVIVIDSLTGNIIRTRQFGGAATNSDFIFHSLQQINTRPRLTGIFSENNQPYQLFRMSSSQSLDFQTVGFFETFNTPTINFDATAISTQSTWADCITFTPAAASNELYVVKAISSDQLNSQIGWAKQFSNMGAYSLAALDRVFDAGYVVTLNGKASAVPFTPVLSIKTDSAGLASTGCEGADFNITKINNSTYPEQTVTLTPTTINAPAQPENYTLQSQPINTQYLCNALNCPPKPVEDTCATTFYRSFRSVHYIDGATDLSISPNNEVIVNGGMSDSPIDPLSGHGTLVRFDANGKLVARKKVRIGNGNSSYLGSQYRLADGNILTLGGNAYNNLQYVTVSKFTTGLNLVWKQSIQIMIPLYSFICDVVESSDGSIFIWYHEGEPFLTQQESRLIKLDASGNIVWSRSYKVPMYSLPGAGKMCQDNQYLYTACGITSGNVTMVMKIEEATGNLVWSKLYQGPGYFTGLYNIQLHQNLILLSGSAALASGGAPTTLMHIDKDGNVQSVTTFDYNSVSVGIKPLVTQNDEIVISGFIPDLSRAPYTGFITFLRLDPNMNVLYSKRVLSAKSATISSLKVANDGGTYEVGSFFTSSYNAEFYLKKYAYDGTMGNCVSENFTFNKSTLNITVKPITLIPGTPVITTAVLPYSEDDYALQQNQLICSSPVTCFKPVLTGPQQICTAGTTYEYRAQRVPGCTAPVSWDIDRRLLKVIAASDTLLKVQFITNGTTRIKAGVFSGCRWLQDSMDVTATLATLALDLGPDSNLCIGNTIKLNAHKGFASYTWQDASVDSLFTVTQPGDYYVTTTDACGGLYSDTVHVLAAPPIPFDLGANQNMCSNDHVSVTAPASFLNYNWSPNYNINSTTAQTVILSPAIDTIFYVKAEKTPGCFAYDSIRIYVKQAVPVQLGNDTSFCSGYTLTVNAGNGFAQYKWNTGAGSASIPVNTTGKYSIITTDANNCLAYDTLQVKVYDNPVIKLSEDSLLCYGSNIKYDAGSGYAQYVWQDGSTAQQFIASAPGKYWVTITDQNKCTASDTAVINRIVAPPSAFLPPDTTICSYAKIELKPKEVFSQYLWSTAAVTPSITVQQGGLYWLQVTDKYNCTGRDSLLLTAKKCLTGFFVPNAFTPHKDGRNDIFKPIILGTLIKYEFTIYNRWGQRVFQSASPQLGWDGTVSGNLQSTNTYVWTCTYQFDNGPVTFEKGTVTLVR